MKAVLFDLYGTLVDIRTDEESPVTWRRFARWMRDHGMDARQADLKREFSFGQRVLRAQPSAYDYPDPDLLPVFAAMLTARGGDASLAEEAAWAFRQASSRVLVPYPETIATLEHLRRQGIRTILLSNAQRCFTMPELEKTGLLPHLDRVFISSDYGCRKPDPAFYRAAMEAENLTAQDCIMVGNDGTSDIRGAEAVGIDAVYLKTATSPDRVLPRCRWVFPDGNIGHVREIFPID